MKVEEQAGIHIMILIVTRSSCYGKEEAGTGKHSTNLINEIKQIRIQNESIVYQTFIVEHKQINTLYTQNAFLK